MMPPAPLLWVVLACAAGTFAIRLWPMLWHKKNGSHALTPRIRRALAALGPAAISALLVASLWPQLAVAQPVRPALQLLAALAAIALTRQVAGAGVALPTLVGVLVFGALQFAAA